jgi:hypothetical protein
VRALVTRPPKDTLRFEAAAEASRCTGGGGGAVVQGMREGNGVLVWLRFADSLGAGDWPLLQRGDTVSPRGAVVAARFQAGGSAHGVALDSGVVTVTPHPDGLAVAARGSGLEVGGAGRVSLDAEFRGLALRADTVACRPQP